MSTGKMVHDPCNHSLTSEESLPPYSTTWGNDVVQDVKKRRRSGPVAWSLVYDSAKQRVRSIARNTSPFLRNKVWPALKKIRIRKKQLYAFLLVLFFGIMPFVIIGVLTSLYGEDKPFEDIFESKTISCGYSFGTPQNATVAGWEALFALDFTFGKFPFSQAKLIDVAWDLIIGRGAQLLAWWASYVVFSDALLRVIERHPTSYQTFTHIALEGACLASIWALIKDLFRTRSKRTWSLFFYMLISITYVLCMPIILSAMTGYTSTTIAWVDVDNTNNIIPATNFKYGYIVRNAGNTTFNNTCAASKQLSDYQNHDYERMDYCNCQLPNGTVMPFMEWQSKYYLDSNNNYTYKDCKLDFPNNTGTYESRWEDGKTLNCNATYNITLFGQTYDARTVNYTSGYCNEDRGYSFMDIYDKSRCLPDTADQSYMWGFSTMLSGVFIFLQLVWTITMYIIWQDAQFNSKLVKSGYEMTQLRAAFTLATAARWRTGMGSRELVRTDTKKLDEQLYGSKKKMKAEVTYEIFRDEVKDEVGEEGLRKRRARARDEEI